jgi:hypothetical protein
MSKLKNFDGSVQIISGLIPKNNNDFPLMEAHSIQVDENGTRLDELLGGFGDGTGCFHNWIRLNELSALLPPESSSCITKTVSYCSKCSLMRMLREDGHDWRDGGTFNGSCTEPRIDTYYCSKCNERYEVVGSPLGHDYGEWYIDESTWAYRRECTRGCKLFQELWCSELSDGTYDVASWSVPLSGELTIPSTYDEKPITQISPEGFERQGITTITLPDSITKIGVSAFSSCYDLERINIPENCSYIGSNAFRHCNNLTIEVAAGNEYYHIENGSLIETNTGKVIFLKDGYMPSTTSSIGSGAGTGKTYAAPIKIPLNITTIEPQAFGVVEGGMTVYVEASEKPKDWADDWCDETVTVIWGCTDNETCEHVWGAWEIDSKPTCTRMGRATSTCTICGKISTRKLAPFGHVESDWIIDVDPTTETEGSKHKVCMTCGEITQVESIPKLEVEDTITYLLTEDGDYLTDEQGNKLII